MKNRNRIIAAIYFLCSALCVIRGLLVLAAGQEPGVYALRFGLAVLFLIIALLYLRREP